MYLYPQRFSAVKIVVHVVLHLSTGSIPDHPTSFKLTWDLEIGVSLESLFQMTFFHSILFGIYNVCVLTWVQCVMSTYVTIPLHT